MMSCCAHNDASQNVIIPMTKLQPAADNISAWPGEPFYSSPLTPFLKWKMLSCWFVAVSSGADSHSCDNRLCHATARLDIDSVGPTLAVCHRHTLTHPGPTPTQTGVRHRGYKKEGASCWTPKHIPLHLIIKKISSLKDEDQSELDLLCVFIHRWWLD